MKADARRQRRGLRRQIQGHRHRRGRQVVDGEIGLRHVNIVVRSDAERVGHVGLEAERRPDERGAIEPHGQAREQVADRRGEGAVHVDIGPEDRRQMQDERQRHQRIAELRLVMDDVHVDRDQREDVVLCPRREGQGGGMAMLVQDDLEGVPG